MANARNKAKNWLCQNMHLVIPLLAFSIPLIVRAIPEILMGQYIVGFDTIGYYVPNTLTWLGNGFNFWSFLSSAPLIYILLMSITSAGLPIVFTLKILGPLVLGLLGFATYFYASKTLSWSPIKSLFVGVLSTLYFVALRISWDMFRSELALVFLFLALILLQKMNFRFRNGLLLSLAMVLVVLTHQLVAVIMFAIIAATALSLALKNKKSELERIIVYSIPAALLLLLIIYISYFVFSSPLLGYSVNYAGGFESLSTLSHLDFVVNMLGFLAFCYLPLVPFIVFGARLFKRNIALRAWVIWLFIPLLLAVISPNSLIIGGVLPFRWILLLTYPLSFCAVEGLFAIKWNWYKVVYKVAAVVIIVALSVGFIALPNSGAIDYFGNYPTYVPKSMLQNTVQLSDCQDTANALLWAKNNLPSNGYLLAHEAFYGWATLSFDTNRLIPYFFENLTDLTRTLQENASTNPMYLIWWVNGTGWYGQPNVPSSFTELYHSGNIAVYQYSEVDQIIEKSIFR